MRFLWCGAVVALACAGVAGAGEAPAKPETGVKTKLSLLFPSASEIQVGLEARGLKLDMAPGAVTIATPNWSKLSDRAKQLQLGALLGSVAVAASARDTAAVTKGLEGVLAGCRAVGIPETANSQVAMKKALVDLKAGAMSQPKLLALLDDLRRAGLRDASAKLDDTAMATVLAGAWLRGGALVGRQVRSDADAAKLSELLARPELITFVNGLAGQVGAGEKATAAQLVALSKKKQFNKADVEQFVEIATKLLAA